jgi:hypothetical protein
VRPTLAKGKMTKTLRIYVIAACLLQFLVFHAQQMIAKETMSRLADGSPTRIPAFTTLTLHMHPFLNLLNLALCIFVAYALIRKKSDSLLTHTLGIIILSSLSAVVLQAIGVVILLPRHVIAM